MSVQHPCRECEGNGVSENLEACSACNGTGWERPRIKAASASASKPQEILPCPFCALKSPGSDSEPLGPTAFIHDDGSGKYKIECAHCDARSSKLTDPHEVIARWNRVASLRSEAARARADAEIVAFFQDPRLPCLLAEIELSKRFNVPGDVWQMARALRQWFRSIREKDRAALEKRDG